MIYVAWRGRHGPVVFGVLCAPDAAGVWRVVDAAPYARWSRIGIRTGMKARIAWDRLADFGRFVNEFQMRWIP